MLREFKEFIAKGSLIDFAIGVVMGAAFTKVTDSLMSNIVNPIAGTLTGADLSNKIAVLKSGKSGASEYSTLEAALNDGAVALGYGGFISSLISFVLTGFVMFLIVKAYNKARRGAPMVEDPADVVLLREIRDALKK